MYIRKTDTLYCKSEEYFACFHASSCDEVRLTPDLVTRSGVSFWHITYVLVTKNADICDTDYGIQTPQVEGWQ